MDERNIMNVLYKLRGNTLSNWSTKNPVLAEREPAIVMIPADSGSGLNEPSVMLKIGDGITAFNDLDYVAAIIDWNAAEGEPGHILNKPFGIETTPDIVFTAEDIANPIERVELPESGGAALVKVSDKVFTTDELNGISVACSYGGTEVVTDNNPLISEVEGTKSIMSEVLQIPVGYVVELDTALDIVLSPGLWLYDYPEEIGIKNFSVTIPGKETVKQLDSKFLNPALQFGETTVKGDTLTWDGNTEGLISINDPESGQPFLYKVSGATITPDDYKNGIIFFAKGLMDESVTFSAEYIDENLAEYGVVYFSDWLWYVPKDNTEVFGAVFPEAGWYHVFPAVGDGVLCTVTIPGYTGFETKTVKKIDEKYLPDGTNLLNEHGFLKQSVLPPGYPYPATQQVRSEVLPLTELFYDEDSGGYNYPYNEQTKFIANKKYAINFDGQEYICPSIELNSNGMYCLIGNTKTMFGEDTGEPFIIAVTDESIAAEVGFSLSCMLTSVLEGEVDPDDIPSSIWLSIDEIAENVVKMQEDFLPNTASNTLVVDVDISTESGKAGTTSIGPDAIISKVNDGHNVILRVKDEQNYFPRKVYHLSAVNNTFADFTRCSTSSSNIYVSTVSIDISDESDPKQWDWNSVSFSANS